MCSNKPTLIFVLVGGTVFDLLRSRVLVQFSELLTSVPSFETTAALSSQLDRSSPILVNTEPTSGFLSMLDLTRNEIGARWTDSPPYEGPATRPTVLELDALMAGKTMTAPTADCSRGELRCWLKKKSKGHVLCSADVLSIADASASTHHRRHLLLFAQQPSAPLVTTSTRQPRPERTRPSIHASPPAGHRRLLRVLH